MKSEIVQNQTRQTSLFPLHFFVFRKGLLLYTHFSGCPLYGQLFYCRNYNIIMIMCPNDSATSAALHSAIIWAAKSQKVAKIIFELGNPK